MGSQDPHPLWPELLALVLPFAYNYDVINRLGSIIYGSATTSSILYDNRGNVKASALTNFKWSTIVVTCCRVSNKLTLATPGKGNSLD